MPRLRQLAGLHHSEFTNKVRSWGFNSVGAKGLTYRKSCWTRSIAWSRDGCSPQRATRRHTSLTPLSTDHVSVRRSVRSRAYACGLWSVAKSMRLSTVFGEQDKLVPAIASGQSQNGSFMLPNSRAGSICVHWYSVNTET